MKHAISAPFALLLPAILLSTFLLGACSQESAIISFEAPPAELDGADEEKDDTDEVSEPDDKDDDEIDSDSEEDADSESESSEDEDKDEKPDTEGV